MSTAGRQALRLPDFIIIGTMKSGTTSLYRWLGERDEVWLPAEKEPHFFSLDNRWRQGLDRYGALFASAPPGCVTGEASTSYTHPGYAGNAAERMASAVPEAKLVCVLRDPVERLRSHYRHEVQRGREHRSITQAVLDPGNEYVGRSLYYTCLAPFLAHFDDARLCIVRFEDLVEPGGEAWATVLEHLGLPLGPAPSTAFNTTAEKRQDTWMLRRLRGSSLLHLADRMPRRVRRLGSRWLTRDGPDYRRRQDSSADPLPDHVLEAIDEDAGTLARVLGRAQLWASRPRRGA